MKIIKTVPLYSKIFKTMVPFVEDEMPAMPGQSRGKKSEIVDAKSVQLNGASPLAKGSIIEFLDRCITCQTEGNVEGKFFNSILMSVNGKHRWIGVGTFTQVDWCGSRNLVSPEVGRDARQYKNAQDLWDALHTRKIIVADILHTKKQVWKDGKATDETEPANYPVLKYAE